MQFSGKFQETSENGSEPYFGPDFDLFAQKFGPPIFLWVLPLLVCSNGLVVKAVDFQSRDPVFKTIGWLQGQLSLSSFHGR